MNSVRVSADGCPGLRPCFAGLDALVPRVIKLGVTSTSAVSEPRTAATTTTAFPRFLDGAAFAAYGPDGCRRHDGFWYLYVVFIKRASRENAYQTLLASHLVTRYYSN